MKSFITFCFLLLSLSLQLQVGAEAQTRDATSEFKKYLNDVVIQVERTEDVALKRSFLNESLENLNQAVDRIGESGISEEGEVALRHMKGKVSGMHEELNGANGFERVADEELDDFANYMQQSMEQALNETITIGIGTALVIALILLLL